MTDNQPTLSSDFSSPTLLGFLIRWIKPLFVIGFATLIVSAIASFLIEEKYESSVILFPVSSNSVSSALLDDAKNGSSQDLLAFGATEQAEQMLQLLHSNKIRDRIIQRFNLMQHYGIDTTSKFKNTLLNEEFTDNINYRRTEFMAVEIEVLDKNPQMAADIANEIAALIDTLKNEMQQDRVKKAVDIIDNEYKQLQLHILLMEDSISTLRELGVIDYQSQAEMLNEQYALALAKNNQQALNSLKKQLNLLAQYGASYESLTEKLEANREQLNQIEQKRKKIKIDAEQILPQKFIINNAYKAEKKAYPVRWLIVVISTISTLLLSILIILTLENYKKMATSTQAN